MALCLQFFVYFSVFRNGEQILFKLLSLKTLHSFNTFCVPASGLVKL